MTASGTFRTWRDVRLSPQCASKRTSARATSRPVQRGDAQSRATDGTRERDLVSRFKPELKGSARVAFYTDSPVSRPPFLIGMPRNLIPDQTLVLVPHTKNLNRHINGKPHGVRVFGAMA